MGGISNCSGLPDAGEVGSMDGWTGQLGAKSGRGQIGLVFCWVPGSYPGLH